MSRQPTGIINIPPCRRRLLLLALLATLPALAGTRGGVHDPVFERLKVAEWGAAGQARMKWSAEVQPPELSTHQRMILRVITKIDGRELEKRRGKGEFFTLVQITDETGKLWQAHESIDLSALESNLINREFFVTQYAFVKAGNYSVTVAVCDGNNLDHSFVTRRVHVDALKDDPLPHAFDGLPTVEFVPGTDGVPDVWFIPDIQSRLNLAPQTKRRIELQILVNTTPSERSMGSASTLRRNMALVIPAMKVFSGINLPNGTVDIAFLDLELRKVVFEQTVVKQPDWYGMSKVFTSKNPGMVDIRTLTNEWKMSGYFLDEVSRRMNAPVAEDTVRVVIVLSGPAFFDGMKENVSELPVGADSRRLFYIRCRTLPVRYPRRNRPGVTPVPQRPVTVNTPMPADDLERAATALNGKVYDAASTEQFRRILAIILGQIADL